MRTDHHETLITLGTMDMRYSNAPELRFLLEQARERCPSTDDCDLVTEHVTALAMIDAPRVVILNSRHGEINPQDVVQKDRPGSQTNNREP